MSPARCSTHLVSTGCPSRAPALPLSSRLCHRFSSSTPLPLLLGFPGMKDESDRQLGERGQVKGGTVPTLPVPAAQQLPQRCHQPVPSLEGTWGQGSVPARTRRAKPTRSHNCFSHPVVARRRLRSPAAASAWGSPRLAAQQPTRCLPSALGAHVGCTTPHHSISVGRGSGLEAPWLCQTPACPHDSVSPAAQPCPAAGRAQQPAGSSTGSGAVVSPCLLPCSPGGSGAITVPPASSGKSRTPVLAASPAHGPQNPVPGAIRPPSHQPAPCPGRRDSVCRGGCLVPQERPSQLCSLLAGGGRGGDSTRVPPGAQSKGAWPGWLRRGQEDGSAARSTCGQQSPLTGAALAHPTQYLVVGTAEPSCPVPSRPVRAAAPLVFRSHSRSFQTCPRPAAASSSRWRGRADRRGWDRPQQDCREALGQISARAGWVGARAAEPRAPGGLQRGEWAPLPLSGPGRAAHPGSGGMREAVLPPGPPAQLAGPAVQGVLHRESLRGARRRRGGRWHQPTCPPAVGAPWGSLRGGKGH